MHDRFAGRLATVRFGILSIAFATIFLSALALTPPALADGGDSGTGAAGGVDSTTGTGGDGANGTAGGGGGAGAVGGAGGSGAGSAGAPGGASPGANGSDASDGTTLGAGGGGGGAHGYVGATLPVGAVAGGNGGNGGSSTAGAGGGGAGGYGAVVTGSVMTGTISAPMTGGNGGIPGSTTGAGSGGSGGIGLMLTGSSNDLTIDGAVTGGSGGDGKLTGFGGAGGVGLEVTGFSNELTVNGSIAGGNGGGGPNPAAGGAGIRSGTGLSVTIGSAGSVSGGTGAGGQANAITFAGSGNTLTLHSGATINGIVGGAGYSLALGGTTAGTFDLGDIGTQFLNVAAFRKIDAGTWTLTGTSTTSASTRILGGTLVMNGSMTNSVFFVLSGTTLEGIGTTGGISAANGGIHAPGNSIGTQTVDGNYGLAPGAILQIEANAAGQSDLVVVGGTVSLTGAILQVLADTGGYSASTQYTIIDNDGVDPVTGTFGSITSSLAFLTPTVIYNGGTGNDVVLTLTVNDQVSFCSAAATANECAVANAVQNLGAGNPLFSAILAQTTAGAQQAFNALSGEVHATVSSTLANDSHYVRDILLGRLTQAYYARANGGTQVAGLGAGGPATAAGLNGAPMMGLGMGSGAYDDDRHPAVASPITFWAQGYGAWGDFESNGDAAGAKRTLGGFMSGMDAMLNDSWRVGGAIGYARSDVSVGSGRFSSADVDSYQLAAYTSGAVGAFVLRGGGVWSWSTIDTERSVVFPGFFERVEASYSGNTGQLFGEVALPFAHQRVAYEPFAGLAWVGVDTGGFTEIGGDAALTSNGANDSVGYTTLGLRTAGSMFVSGVEVVPRGSLAWLHAFGDVDPDQGLAFATFGQSFVVSGVPLAEDSALIEAGLDIRLAPDSTLGISYNGQLASDVQDHGVSGRVDWRF